MQGAFIFLTDLFDRVRLQTDIRNMLGMVCQPYRTSGRHYEEAYRRRMTGERLAYQARLRHKFRCPEFTT